MVGDLIFAVGVADGLAVGGQFEAVISGLHGFQDDPFARRIKLEATILKLGVANRRSTSASISID
jgi:hypothetical protein